jgi:hypothetical protein
MKAQLRSHVAALFLLAPATITFTALPSAALAQPATPAVRSLEVTSDHGVSPGSRLRFRLEGSPGAKASVRIRGVQSSIPLREVERGVYVGRYVVNRDDRIEDGAPMRAILRYGNRTVSANYNVPASLTTAAIIPPPPPPPLRIERFSVTTLDRIEPGAELRFVVEGMPGAAAFVDLPGVASNVQLREVRPGLYEGGYTIRRSDSLNVSGPVVATLRAGDQVATANLAQPLVVTRPANVSIQILSHPNNAQVGGGVTHVRGRTAPFASVNVKVQAVPPIVGQFGVTQQVFSQTLQADANGHFDFNFSSPFPVPGTRYDVAMVATKADVTTEARLVLYQRQG